MLLKINNLHVLLKKKHIIRGLNLEIKKKEIHILMGPNGAGKSTLGNTLIGEPKYKIIEGTIFFNNKDISNLSVEERAHAGIFLSFQNPTEIPGVSNIQFLKIALNSIRKAKKKKELNFFLFMKKLKKYAKTLNLTMAHLKRGVNENFSGGEKKKNELLQMILLNPTFCILDEIDSGLDIDALKIIAKQINNMKKNTSFLIITHYQRLLNYIKPDQIHILKEGKIIKTGDHLLINEIEKNGYTNT